MISKEAFVIFWQMMSYLIELIYLDPLKPPTKYTYTELREIQNLRATKTVIVQNLFLNANCGLPPELN